MPRTEPPISSLLPPLIFGTATFNYQYNEDPYKLPTTKLVHKALSAGIRAFDTSPYYGPAETILGQALSSPFNDTNAPFPRADYFIVTKVGRISSSEFDYSVPWVYESIQRSLERLRTSYLDLVYCHDVEFVTPAEVLAAVIELRRIRDTEGSIKYVGISGYPVSTLCGLAEMILKETGQPLDCIMSYGNFTIQNRRLQSDGITRLRNAGVDVVVNASMLGMGLLRSEGVPLGSLGNWHPSPEGLRDASRKAAQYCESVGERLEVVAIRWALETWLKEGESVGSTGDSASGLQWKRGGDGKSQEKRLGVSAMGVSNEEELEDTLRVWRSILDGQEGGKKSAVAAGREEKDHDWSLQRREEVQHIVGQIWEGLGEWQNFAWASPGEDFVRVTPSKE